MLFARLRRSHFLWLAAVTLAPTASCAAEPFRAGHRRRHVKPRRAVVPDDGFTARNGVNHHDERAVSQSAGYCRIRGLPAAITCRTAPAVAIFHAEAAHSETAAWIKSQGRVASTRSS